MRNTKRGRPRKEKDQIESWRFRRTCLALAAYNEARKRSEKHAAALKETVDIIKKGHPEMKTSESEVRRILAAWQPRTEETVLRVKASPATPKDAERWRRLLEQIPAVQDCAALPITQDATRSNPRIIQFGFGTRPHYPRHNRKDQLDKPVNN